MRKFFSVLVSVVFFLLSGVALAWILLSIFALMFLQDVRYSIDPISYIGLQYIYPVYIGLFAVLLLIGLIYKKIEKRGLYTIIVSILTSITIFALLFLRVTDYQILADIYDSVHLNYIGSFSFLLLLFLGYKLNKKTFFRIAIIIVLGILTLLSFTKVTENTIGYVGFSDNIPIAIYILSFICIFILFFGYKIMERKLFLIAMALWMAVISGCIVYWNQPIKGLEDIPESVFALPEDIKSFSNIIPQEKCEQLKKSADVLDKNRNPNSYQDLIPNTNPLKNIFIEYTTAIQGVQNFDWKNIINGSSNDLITAEVRSEILKGNFLEKDLRELYKGEAIQKLGQQEKNLLEIHKKWVDLRNIYPDALKEIRIILYPENEKAIKDFIILIDDITRNTVGICRDSVSNTLSSRMTQMSYTSNIQATRILNNYAFILIQDSDYKGAYSVLRTLIEYTNHISKNQGYALIGGMVYSAMRSITYSYINTFIPSLPKSYQIKLAKYIENAIPLPDMILNIYRGEYLLSSYIPLDIKLKDGTETEIDVSINTLAIPFVFNPKENNLILRDCLRSLMNELNKNIPKGKYNCEELADITKKQSGFHNFIGRRLIRASLSLKHYNRIFLLEEMQKNTLLQKLRGQANIIPVVPNNTTPACEKSGGQWSEEFRECLGIDATSCQNIGGTFNECASACRNDPKAEICTMQCVQVCEVK